MYLILSKKPRKTNAKDALWTDATSTPCANNARVYCFAQP